MQSFLLRLCVFLLMACVVAYSQTTYATITGTVTDATGAVVPNAKITAINTETNVEISTNANDAGNYVLSQLRQGTYAVRASASGFQDFVAQHVVLAARDVRRMDIGLQVGAVATAVEVTAGATLIDAETSRIADTQTTTELTQIPHNARWIWAFLVLSPNVVSGTDGYRFAGSRGNQNNWAIDGTTMTDGYGDTIGPLGNYIESFQEMSVGMANNSAEFSTIGQVSMVSKGGTNQLHGAVFDYYTTPWFRARPYLAKARTGTRMHLPGFSLSGPVTIPKLYNGRDRTFFFTSFETSRGNASTQLLNPSVPIQAWREGDFSGLKAGQVIYDPFSGQPFPGNRIPANRINPVSQKFQERFYPLPNTGNPNVYAVNNYIENKDRPWYGPTYVVGRVDHHFSSTDFIFGRITGFRTRADQWEGNLPTVGQRNQQRDVYAATASYTHIFGATLTNEVRWGLAYNHNPIEGPINGLELVRELGLTGLAPNLPDISGLLKVNWTGIGLTTPTQLNYNIPGYRNHNEEFQDTVSWLRGRHNVRAGFQAMRTIYNDLMAADALFGQVNFSSRFTGQDKANQGHPYADFLLGIPTTAQRAFAPVRADRKRWQSDFFITDDFKLHPRLTLNMGVRYERHRPWTEDKDMISLFDITRGSIVVPDGAMSRVSPLFPAGYAPIITASAAGLPERTLVRADSNNIAPRFGVAWRPFGKDTVIRAGYGIYYDLVPTEPSTTNIPYTISEMPYTNPLNNPDVIFPRVFPDTGSGPKSVALPSAINPDLRTPYSMQYNFTIQHQAWDTGLRVSYIGTNTRKGEYKYNYNSPVPDARLFVQKPRPLPQYPDIMYYTNGAGHQYNALTFEARREMVNGLYFQTSWTWARDIYDLYRGSTLENPFDRERERAVAQDIPTHRFVASTVYDLPFGRGRTFLTDINRFANLAVGGWELSGIYTMHSGQFLAPSWSGPDPVGMAYTTGSTRPVVTIRPDLLRDPNLPEDQRTRLRWFDTTAFGAPPVGRYGTSAKGVIKGPGTNVWNLGLAKSFLFGERARLRWELSATNAFNHPNWANPNTRVSSAGSVGVISGAGGTGGENIPNSGAREFRMGFRVEW